jgi:hypothetical protein
MPGVYVTTQTRSGPSAPNIAPSGQVFMAGQAERGTVTQPVLVRNIAEFTAEFGGRTTYSHLYDNVKVFFEEGGAQAWIARVVGAAASTGTVTLDDRQTPAEDTLKIDAASPGAWSDDLDIVVEDLAGSTTQISVVFDGETVETFTGDTVADLVEALGNSSYVVVTNIGSDGVAPANKPAEGTFHLSAGTDDRNNIDADDYTSALDLFDVSLGAGAVAIPGVGATVHSALLDHARSTNRRIAILSHSETATKSDLTTAADALNSEYGGLFGPWVQVATETGTKYTSPEGYVAACRNRAHAETGPWRVPAGQIAIARSLVGLKYDYTRADTDELDAAKVNTIRYIAGTIRLYGWRSVSDDTTNYAMLSGRDVLNSILVEAEARMEQYVFQTIDGKGQLLASIGGTLVGILEPMRNAGGLYERYAANGTLLDRGYVIDSGANVNTLETLSNNEVRAQVSVRVAPSAAMISVTIVKVGLLSNL